MTNTNEQVVHFMPKPVAQAIDFIPKISKTSKMPCHSYSLPAQECKTGKKLVSVKGSVCEGCYALKGFYHMPTVKAPRYENLETLTHEKWTEIMIKHISKTSLKNGFFRWHDSGDIQSVDHFKNIVAIALALPSINFWIPTKEAGMLKTYASEGLSIPSNLSVRLSMPLVDQAPNLPDSLVKLGVNTSTVHKNSAGFGDECKAYTNKGKCGDCRACWDVNVENVSYPIH